MWIQTGLMTSPARNILGLCKKGRIGKTSVVGSVSFFGIDSENDTEPVQIEVEYAGDSYIGNQVHYTTNNGSWRLNFYGETDEGKSLLTLRDPRWEFRGLDHVCTALWRKIFLATETQNAQRFSQRKRNISVSVLPPCGTSCAFCVSVAISCWMCLQTDYHIYLTIYLLRSGQIFRSTRAKISFSIAMASSS